MIQHITKLTSRSIEQGGLPTDYKKALAEYIWNGFDAGASRIDLDFTGNAIGYLTLLSITDNGSGIDLETIESSFGNFLDSLKAEALRTENFVKGRKGKGRYAFSIFANKCEWNTTFKTGDGALLDYSISINKSDQQNFSTSDVSISANLHTGTRVQFSHFFDLTADLLLRNDFYTYLASEFGWFLHLNRDKAYSIYINGRQLDYRSIISDEESLTHPIGDFNFTISYLRWNMLIGDKFYFYFLDSSKKENFRKHTSFNNNTVEFFHSVYVESNLFDSFRETESDAPVIPFAEKNQADPVFKALLKFLDTYLARKEKEFVRDTQAQKLIANYETLGILPHFSETNKKEQSEDLKHVLEEIYCIQPKIFKNLRKEQSKMLVGLISVLLNSKHRLAVLDVLESVTRLSDEEKMVIIATLQK